MKQDPKLTGLTLARRTLYGLATLVVLALWTPFGLVVGLIVLTLGALGTGSWL